MAGDGGRGTGVHLDLLCSGFSPKAVLWGKPHALDSEHGSVSDLLLLAQWSLLSAPARPAPPSSTLLHPAPPILFFPFSSPLLRLFPGDFVIPLHGQPCAGGNHGRSLLHSLPIILCFSHTHDWILLASTCSTDYSYRTYGFIRTCHTYLYECILCNTNNTQRLLHTSKTP